MKLLLWLLVLILFSAAPAFSQKHKGNKSKQPTHTEKPVKSAKPIAYTSDEPPPPPPEPKPKPIKMGRLTSDVFRDVTIGKWGIAGLSLPLDLTNESDTSTPYKNKNVTWTNYLISWKQSAENYPSSLEVDLNVTMWDAEFKTIVPDLRPELATPEYMLLLDLMGEEKNKDKPDSPVKESRPLAVNGVQGGFFRAEFPSDKNRFLAGWYTYRYFEGKAQRISFTVTGRMEELPKLNKIIESLRLQSTDRNPLIAGLNY